ncbi:LysR family transcriptional regulator [Vibrio quintilis]|uniref:DNA-binding transcriptional regulator IlvY n=1 Tax=Vibrio quintilis TaxID=1117707 RepID=A0A1M7YVV0_9VIBR|nr:LysR family transcriptional regulator [Vibrio quintilis]SHO56702.1 DNA-binding transcriptional regulator IlvY [Vibrio quintilis]
MLLEGIETLLVLSKEGTMSRTASQLYISQSAVSKRITRLENTLGKKLVVPDGRHIKLTNDAKQLIDAVGPGFHQLTGLIYDQQALEDDTLIRLDCSETLAASHLCHVIKEHLTQDPFIRITTNHTPRIIENVSSGKATIGFCAGHLPGSHGLKTYHLNDEPFFIISSKPLKKLPSQLITIDLSNPANMYQASVLNQQNITPVMEMDSYTAAAKLALSDVAPALIPLSVIKILEIPQANYFHFNELIPLDRPVSLCLRNMTFRSPRIKALITAIADAVPTATSMPSECTSSPPKGESISDLC